MEFQVKNIVYICIITLSLYFILWKNIEGNTCSRSNPNRTYITNGSITCTADGPNPPVYQLKSVYCDDKGPYIDN